MRWPLFIFVLWYSCQNSFQTTLFFTLWICIILKTDFALLIFAWGWVTTSSVYVGHDAGYCGADLKALCTEAALRALRRRYPQIYESQDKLQIDAASVSIAVSDFYCAMRRIVPTAQRSMSSPARPLSMCVRPLLQCTFSRILKLFEHIFPRALALISGAGEAGLNTCC